MMPAGGPPADRPHEGCLPVAGRGYLRVFRSYWRMIVAFAVLGVLGAGVAVATATPVYRSSTQLFLSTTTGATPSDLLSGNTFAQDRVQSYVAIATTPLVLQPVVARLRLGVTAAELADRVQASSPLGTVLIDLSVSDTSAARSVQIMNAVARQFARTVEGLSPARASAGPIRVTSTRPAVIPTTPLGAGRAVKLLDGLLVGLVVGLVVALARRALDPTVRSRAELAQLTPLPVVGAITRRRGTPSAAGTRALERLSTGLQYREGLGRSRSVLVTSPVEGDGTTTVAGLLADSVAAAGLRVVRVDVAPGATTAAPSPAGGAPGLADVLAGDAPLESALRGASGGRPAVLPAGSPRAGQAALVSSRAMGEVLDRLTGRFDYVVVDAPAVLTSTAAAALAAHVDGTLVVVAVGRTARTDVRSALDRLDRVGVQVHGLVVNLVPEHGLGEFTAPVPDASDPADGLSGRDAGAVAGNDRERREEWLPAGRPTRG